ncbi:hypothetical protein [Alteribacter natronophilus]|uniref:hypothetical protein n=1 Tax=Alteribacter natronophilus TaxID=2583810 RepID=UPI00110DC4BA|nr:hypothetical protein [Alteribacter natronophilus]TMW70124.1 hypothetical protein FGB90_18325 [Alteribacter natronophilus]
MITNLLEKSLLLFYLFFLGVGLLLGLITGFIINVVWLGLLMGVGVGVGLGLMAHGLIMIKNTKW